MKAAPIPELTAVTQGIQRALERQPQHWEELSARPRWEVYTDGSAPILNPGGVIGFASVFVLGDHALEISGGVPARTADPPTSNNRAEIAGVIAVLELLYRAHQDQRTLPSEIDVVCDSQYVVHCAQGRWKKHKNRDLWQRFDQLAAVARAQRVRLDYRWTRAHVGTHWNERADVLAKEAALAEEARPTTPCPPTESAPVRDAEPPTHYHLRLFSTMSGRVGGEGIYELRTPERSRLGRLDVRSARTPDETEYLTLNAALTDLLDTLHQAQRSPADFRLFVESSRDLMLKQIQGLYGVKSERLIPLHTQTRQLIRQFAGVRWQLSDKNELKNLAQSPP